VRRLGYIVEMTKDFFREVANSMLDRETAEQIAEQERALAQNPDWAEGHYHLAQLLRVQHKHVEAKSHLLIALEKKPSLADAHVALGEIYIVEGDLARAREHAEFGARFGNGRLLEQFERHIKL
jgi:tetratricopeptide (TPR) repeat protein